MARNTEQARADLRARLLDIAEHMIETEGLAAVKARPLAAEAGCAVGAIYNVFGDLNDLILAVNGRTFARLGQEVGQAAAPDAPAQTALITLGHAYLRFAVAHPKRWRALFEVELTAQSDVPDWYRQELGQLFAYIAAPVSRLRPDLPPAEVALMTRALFSSVHGIVWLGVENRISGVPLDQLERMIEIILTEFSK